MTYKVEKLYQEFLSSFGKSMVASLRLTISSGSTQEDKKMSRHDRKIVDRDVCLFDP